MKPIDRLKQLALIHIKTKYPNNPYPESVIHPYKPSTANGLTRCVIDWINFNGGFARRVTVTGRMIDGTKKFTDVMGHTRIVGSVSYQKSSMVRGSADVSATIPPYGRTLEVEVKINKDRQSAAQKKYEQKITSAGGIYVIVHTFDEFLDFWDSLPEKSEQMELFTNLK